MIISSSTDQHMTHVAITLELFELIIGGIMAGLPYLLPNFVD